MFFCVCSSLKMEHNIYQYSTDFIKTLKYDQDWEYVWILVSDLIL